MPFFTLPSMISLKNKNTRHQSPAKDSQDVVVVRKDEQFPLVLIGLIFLWEAIKLLSIDIYKKKKNPALFASSSILFIATRAAHVADACKGRKYIADCCCHKELWP